MNRIIKMEEEEYPLSSDYDQVFFNNCITTFYNQDSSHEIIQAKCTAQQVLHYLCQTIDLCDTPLAEIMQFVQSNSAFRGVDLDLVKTKILKQKNLLKRNRARNRKFIEKTIRNNVELNIINDQVEEYKKQRNRMSAQISRDRKKQKVKQLQDMNRKLQEECDQRRIENQKLQQQLNKTKSNKDSPFEPLKNKITKLLILLGIICLVGMIKDLFSQQSSKTPLNKFTDIKNYSFNQLKPKDDFFVVFTEEDKSKVMESIETPISEIINQKTILTKIKDKIQKGIKDCKISNFLIPHSIRKQLDQAKRFAVS